jgi:glycosyltransferase involved in cell wall biosynthesis
LTNTLRGEKFDIVHLESLFMAPYIGTIKRLSKAKIVLRSHNLEYMIWQRMANASKNSMKTVYLNHLARQLKDYEISVIKQVDGIASISPKDAERYMEIEKAEHIVTIPFGLNLDEYKPENNKTDAKGLFHLGAMDWMPNIEGVNWFLKNSWGQINEMFPDLQLYLAGKSSESYSPPCKLKNINLLGEVKDAKEFMNSHKVMLVPLLSGGGIRIKIIEGMALGKTVISTTIGAEGIKYEDGVNIIIADTEKEFLDAITKLNNNPELIDIIGRNARINVEKHYDNSVLSKNLVSFYKSL